MKYRKIEMNSSIMLIFDMVYKIITTGLTF